MKDFERDKNVISQLHNIFDLRLRKHCRMYFSLLLRGDNLVITTLPVHKFTDGSFRRNILCTNILKFVKYKVILFKLLDE
jgi:hypothetical protein